MTNDHPYPEGDTGEAVAFLGQMFPGIRRHLFEVELNEHAKTYTFEVAESDGSRPSPAVVLLNIAVRCWEERDG